MMAIPAVSHLKLGWKGRKNRGERERVAKAFSTRRKFVQNCTLRKSVQRAARRSSRVPFLRASRPEPWLTGSEGDEGLANRHQPSWLDDLSGRVCDDDRARGHDKSPMSQVITKCSRSPAAP